MTNFTGGFDMVLGDISIRVHDVYFESKKLDENGDAMMCIDYSITEGIPENPQILETEIFTQIKKDIERRVAEDDETNN